MSYKDGKLQAGGEAKRNPCHKCEDDFHSAVGTAENTDNLFCHPYGVRFFLCISILATLPFFRI